MSLTLLSVLQLVYQTLVLMVECGFGREVGIDIVFLGRAVVKQRVDLLVLVDEVAFRNGDVEIFVGRDTIEVIFK